MDSIPTKDRAAFIAAAIASSTLKFIDKGAKLEKVDELTQIHRISTCEKCPNFNEEFRACSICKCPMDFKSSLMYDPIFGTSPKALIKCADKANPKW